MIKELIQYARHYPKSEVQDYVKIIYQSEFAGGHLISNPSSSLAFLKQEIESVDSKQLPQEHLYEWISRRMIRVNLRVYQHCQGSLDVLNQAFVTSANNNLGSLQRLDQKLDSFYHQVLVGKIPLIPDDVDAFITQYRLNNYPLLHHSQTYRDAYLPSYRVLHLDTLTEEMRFVQIKHFIQHLMTQKSQVVVALDGKCTSGKTTFAKRLQKEFDAFILPMDDFFLEKKQKTEERLQEIGGNIQYERLVDLLSSINPTQPIQYLAFDCTTQKYYTKKSLTTPRLIIVEGVYSMHPQLLPFYDGTIYLDVSSRDQMKRLASRSSPSIYQKFIDEWIPLENTYFNHHQLRYLADIIV